MHIVVMHDDLTKIMVEEIRYVTTPALVPTTKAQSMGKTLGTLTT